MFIGKIWTGKRNNFIAWDKNTREITEENDTAEIVIGYADTEEAAIAFMGDALILAGDW